MPKARKSHSKSLSTYEKISSACLFLSLLANAYLGYSTYALQASNIAFERQLQQREDEPRLVQAYLIVPGNSFKLFKTIDGTKAIIENGAHPEFVHTPLLDDINGFIEAEDAILPLKSMQATFITLRNDGKTVAQGVKLIAEQSDQDLPLDDIHPGTIKLIPIHFVQSQPQV